MTEITPYESMILNSYADIVLERVLQQGDNIGWATTDPEACKHHIREEFLHAVEHGVDNWDRIKMLVIQKQIRRND